MPFISGGDRYQVMFTALDDMVAPDSEARVIDAFVGSLDLDAMGFDRAEAPDRGRPAYEPADLLKLYVYGYRNGIRSSRKLARACEVNVEVMWLIGSLAPDFRTVANFRRDNAAALKGVFGEFVARVMAGMEPGFRSVDGTKVRASNAKDRNFTPSKLDDRIARLEGHIGEYPTSRTPRTTPWPRAGFPAPSSRGSSPRPRRGSPAMRATGRRWSRRASPSSRSPTPTRSS